MVGGRTDDGTRVAWLLGMAQAGHERALTELVEIYLPLVHTVAGWAVSGSGDIDDLVRRAVARIARDITTEHPAADSLPGWLVNRTLAETRGRPAIAAARPVYPWPGEERATAPTDFAAAAIATLGMSGSALDVVAAIRWLDPADRDVLAVWWLVQTGHLPADQAGRALDRTAADADDALRSMAERLSTGQQVMVAMRARPGCPQLAALVARSDGAERRAAEARHVWDCPTCRRTDPAGPGQPLAGLPLVPPTPLLAEQLTGPFLRAAMRSGIRTAAGTRPAPHRAPAAHRENGPRPWGLRDLLIGTVAALVVVAAAAYLTRGPGGDPHPPPSPAPVASDSLLPSPTLASAPIGAAQESDSPAATERAAVVLPSQAPGGPRYGSNVDVAEAVPPPFQQPGQLPVRPTGTPVTAAGGTYGLPDANSTGGDWFLKRRGDNVTMQGTGYLRVFWGIFFADGRVATMTMPTWTGLSGRLFHVASGGGHRMDDARPATAGVQPGQTWMGSPGTGFDRLPGGAQQMWGFEYYYLDGQVTLHNNEWNTDYDLAVQPESAGDISTELGTRPGTDYDYVRYGLVRDTGTDGAPVPQYVTRATPADPTTVAQHSQV